MSSSKGDPHPILHWGTLGFIWRFFELLNMGEGILVSIK
jgi:hypothetical protein